MLMNMKLIKKFLNFLRMKMINYNFQLILYLDFNQTKVIHQRNYIKLRIKFNLTKIMKKVHNSLNNKFKRLITFWIKKIMKIYI